jgi:hypothetical protein
MLGQVRLVACFVHVLQIILDFYIPEKELAKTCSQISFIYFQSFMIFSQELLDPTEFELGTIKVVVIKIPVEGTNLPNQ